MAKKRHSRKKTSKSSSPPIQNQRDERLQRSLGREQKSRTQQRQMPYFTIFGITLFCLAIFVALTGDLPLDGKAMSGLAVARERLTLVDLTSNGGALRGSMCSTLRPAGQEKGIVGDYQLRASAHLGSRFATLDPSLCYSSFSFLTLQNSCASARDAALRAQTFCGVQGFCAFAASSAGARTGQREEQCAYFLPYEAAQQATSRAIRL